MAEWKMKGKYFKNCNCLATCPCDTIGVPAPHKQCEGAVGMQIEEGHFDGLDLSGLKWVVAFHWPGALHEGNGTIEPFIDENANEDQRNALLQILSGEVGNAWFEVLASIVTTVEEPRFVPIEIDIDKDQRRANVSVPGMVETTSKPLTIPATDDLQHVIVRMPDGMEYKEMEVAQTGALKGMGALKFDWEGTHSSLAAVEHTHEGLVA
jgi:hypothetical protein